MLAIIRQYHCESLLAVLIRLNLALTHPRSPSQEQIVRAWAPPEIAEPLLQLARDSDGAIIFHEVQVLNLVRLTLLHCPRDTGQRCVTQSEFIPLTRALLMMTDLVFPSESTADRRAVIFSNFTRSELFHHDEAYLPHAMARSHDLFIMLPRVLSAGGNRPNIPAIFKTITGLEPEDYLGLGFGVLSYYDQIDPVSIGHSPIAIQRATFLKDVRLAPDVSDRLWDCLSMTLGQYRVALQAEWNITVGPGRWAAMRTFNQFPMIEFPDGAIACLSRRLLRDRFTHGMYWILANALNGAERDRFTEFFGDVFEEYVRRSFLRALGRSFYPRATYGRTARPLADGGLATKKSVGLIECKAGRLLLRTRESGGEADLEAGIEKSFERAAEQLWDAVRACQNGDIQGVEIIPEMKYYPIVITYEPLPAHPFALELYERILHRDGRLQSDRIKPVTLLNTRDVESLEAIIQDGEEWPDFLSRKHTNRYRFLPFHNYIYARFSGKIPRNRYLQARWRRIGEMIGMRLFGEPLKAG